MHGCCPVQSTLIITFNIYIVILGLSKNDSELGISCLSLSRMAKKQSSPDLLQAECGFLTCVLSKAQTHSGERLNIEVSALLLTTPWRPVHADRI